ncbi:unnamed protein product [Orchesella dallaii]|uniref:J domain-containing protein n=1 Tax=Orchesella dallaii TaxID=48710 RepID=A0ABP1PVH6_9HEXA
MDFQDDKLELYRVLELGPNCTVDDVRKQYKKQSLIYHPDKNKNRGATVMFQKIGKAHEVLTNVEKREKYDRANGKPEDIIAKPVVTLMALYMQILYTVVRRDTLCKVCKGTGQLPKRKNFWDYGSNTSFNVNSNWDGRFEKREGSVGHGKCKNINCSYGREEKFDVFYIKITDRRLKEGLVVFKCGNEPRSNRDFWENGNVIFQFDDQTNNDYIKRLGDHDLLVSGFMRGNVSFPYTFGHTTYDGRHLRMEIKDSKPCQISFPNEGLPIEGSTNRGMLIFDIKHE